MLNGSNNGLNNFEYLIVLLLCFVPTFILSFVSLFSEKKLVFKIFSVTILAAIPFIIWDIYATAAGHWGFNRDFNLSFYIGNLPFEEYLFFICIPFSCLFTWFNLNKYFQR